MVFKVSDLLALATELSKDKMQYVSLREYKYADNNGFSVKASLSFEEPDAIGYEELESVPNIDF